MKIKLDDTTNLYLDDYIEHIRYSCIKISEYLDGLTEEQFQVDEKTQDAVQSRLKTIGEAANYITKRFPEFVAEHQAIPFSGMYGMRNIIVHAYFKVDLKAIWNISQNDIPKLKEYLDSIDNLNNSTPTPPKP